MVQQAGDGGQANRFIGRGLAVPQRPQQRQADEQDGNRSRQRQWPDRRAGNGSNAATTTDESSQAHEAAKGRAIVADRLFGKIRMTKLEIRINFRMTNAQMTKQAPSEMAIVWLFEH
jgi:hypothetical protein